MTSDERERNDRGAFAEEEQDADVAERAEGADGDGTSERDGDGVEMQEVQELKDRYLRLAAEYDNYRKRTDRERAEGRDRAQGQVVEQLLEPLDDLQRVAQFDAEATTIEALLEGVRMVERKLLRALESLGLEPLDARGKPFNPEEHEALMTAPTERAEEDDTVGEVFHSGYRFRGTLIRPARVQVRKHEG
ncbi:MAG TPA: nucleotide exchange factor GrpE [Longimicrobiaceae bacterium]|nr:nucleotide exchange factor GrpE [Longimicrobiaceae bacterium]